MARLRHIALAVKDLEKSAAFYERVFKMKRCQRKSSEIADVIYLSDGEINLALLKYKGKRGSGLDDPDNFVGTHHFGFQVDNLEEAHAAIEAAGGKFFFDLGKTDEVEFERKFKDPDGIIFDISHKGWIGTSSKR